MVSGTLPHYYVPIGRSQPSKASSESRWNRVNLWSTSRDEKKSKLHSLRYSQEDRYLSSARNDWTNWWFHSSKRLRQSKRLLLIIPLCLIFIYHAQNSKSKNRLSLLVKVDQDTLAVPKSAAVDGEGSLRWDSSGIVMQNEGDSAAIFENQLMTAPRGSEALEAELCGRLPCRYLFPIWIGEQETKAQMHLYELARVAKSTNAVLVLPNMVKSRFGTCGAYAFDEYFVPRLSPTWELGIKIITQRTWKSIYRPSSKTHFVRVTHSKDVLSSTSSTTLNEQNLTYLRCLGKRLIDTSAMPASAIAAADKYWLVDDRRQLLEEQVTAHIGGLYDDNKAETVFVHYEVRYPLSAMSTARTSDVSSVVPHFDYQPRWTELATQASLHMGSYIAVHWRMETLDSHILPACADALIGKVREVAKEITGNDQPVLPIYLATDYPLERADMPHSSTFHVQDENHINSIAALTGEIAKDPKLRLTSWMMEGMRLLEDPTSRFNKTLVDHLKEAVNVDKLDPGLLGILDKIIAIRANGFIKGKAGECSKISSYTRQIELTRRELGRAQAHEWGLHSSGTVVT